MKHKVQERKTATPRMLVLELNEAEKHFLEKFVAEEKLPTFKKLLNKGNFFETHIRSWDSNTDTEHAWRQLSPWMVWPSIYTGMTANEHNIIGFRQKTAVLEGHCLWDILNQHKITTGVFGSLMSYPLRQNPCSLFYFPDATSETKDCYPKSYRSLQVFLSFLAEHYADQTPLTLLKAIWKLIRGILKGLPLKTAYEILAQIPREISRGIAYYRNRALLQAKVQMDIFQLLYRRFQPAFVTLHLNHIAYMQHRYWRAAEPEHFKETLGELDNYYYGDIETRKNYELSFKDAILESFMLTDQFLADILAEEDEQKNSKEHNNPFLLVILTGLGQKKMDPTTEIHNPEFQLKNIKHLFRLIDVKDYEMISMHTPEMTINFSNAAEASLAAYKISNLEVLGEYPLFQVKQLEDQLFLNAHIPSEIWFLDSQAWIEDKVNEHIFPLFDYIELSPVKDQSTAHHQDKGWALFYGNVAPLMLSKLKQDKLDVTEISPLLLGYFNIKPNLT